MDNGVGYVPGEKQECLPRVLLEPSGKEYPENDTFARALHG
jgi:hypothetical protein